MKKQFIAAILSLCMMMLLLPTTVFAAENYDLYLYLGKEAVGKRVTSENAADVLGDGTVSYDPATHTLTLNNAKLAGIYTYGTERKVLTIKVIGECIIDSQRYNAINLYASTSAGPVYNRDSLVITGDGTLKINALNGSAVGISTYDDVTIDGANVEINSANNIAIAIQSQRDPNQGDIDLNIIDSTVTAVTNGSAANAIYTVSGGIKIDHSTVTVGAESSVNPALWAASSIEITGKSNVIATGGSSNTFYTDEDIVINDSVVKATDTSEEAGPVLYAYGNIMVENGSDVTAESKGMRGIFANGDMTINDSTVTSSGTIDGAMVVVGTLNVNHSKLTAFSNPNDMIPAIVTEHLAVTASDITANGGISLYELYTGSTDNISFSIMPADGKLIEFKVDSENWDGCAAVHFKEGEQSPYDATVNFDADAMSLLGSYRYIHIGEHIHAGGTATCEDKAVCDDCGREYGEALGHSLVKTKVKEATCTEEGYTGDEVCKNCGEILKQGEIIPKLAHSYQDGKCTVCGMADPDYQPVSDAPDTGDSNDVGWVISFMVLALCGVLTLTLIRKKSTNNQ